VDERQLKKLLAGLCISGLLAGASIAPTPTSAMGASGWGGGKSGAGSTESGSGWGATKPSAGGTQKEEKKSEKEKAGEQKPEEKPAPKPGGSGW